jgi:hypothetical protein
MVHRGLKGLALGAALAASIAAFTPTASAAGTVTVEGFRAAAPKSGSKIPKAVVGPSRRAPGKTLSKCDRKDAIMVIFAYRGMNDKKDRIKVNWFLNGASYFVGKALAPDGSDGRAFRSLSPGVKNGLFRVDVLLNGNLAKRAFVTKACAGAPT